MQQEFSRKAKIRSAWIVALCLAGCPVLASAEKMKGPAPDPQKVPPYSWEVVVADLATAPNVPPPITRTKPVQQSWSICKRRNTSARIAEGKQYKFWSFNGTVPGPMIRVRVGDIVEIHLTNSKDSSESHNIDFHAVNGPGGGAAKLNTEPGETTGLESSRRSIPGSTCTIAPPHHRRSRNTLPTACTAWSWWNRRAACLPWTRNSTCSRATFYTKEGKGGVLEFDHAKGSAEHPTYVVYNGMAGSLRKEPAQGEGRRQDPDLLRQCRSQPGIVMAHHRRNFRQGLDRRFADDAAPGKRADHTGAGCGIFGRGVYRRSPGQLYQCGPLDLSHRERCTGCLEGGREREPRHL